jgi:hypothetical protein
MTGSIVKPPYYLTEFNNPAFQFSIIDYLNCAVQGKRIPTLPIHSSANKNDLQKTHVELSSAAAFNWTSNFYFLQKIWADVFLPRINTNINDKSTLTARKNALLTKQQLLATDTEILRLEVLAQTIQSNAQSGAYNSKSEILKEALRAYLLSVIIPQAYIEYLFYIYPYVKGNTAYRAYLTQELNKLVNSDVIKCELDFIDSAFLLLSENFFTNLNFDDYQEHSFFPLIQCILNMLHKENFDYQDNLAAFGFKAKKRDSLLAEIKRNDIDHNPLMACGAKALEIPNFAIFLGGKISETVQFFVKVVNPLYDEAGNLLDTNKTISKSLPKKEVVELQDFQKKLHDDEIASITNEINQIDDKLIEFEHEEEKRSTEKLLISFSFVDPLDEIENFEQCFENAIARYEKNFTSFGHFHIFHSYHKLHDCREILAEFVTTHQRADKLQIICYSLNLLRGDLHGKSFKSFLLDEILKNAFLRRSLEIATPVVFPRNAQERADMIKVVCGKLGAEIAALLGNTPQEIVMERQEQIKRSLPWK